MPGHGTSYRPPKCRRCRRPDTEAPISRRGLCPECAMEAVEKGIREMAEGQGSTGAKWKERYKAGMRRYLEELG